MISPHGGTAGGSSRPALRASGIRKRYGSRRALDGVDLVVEPGEIVGLVGPNGAGKTTLVSIVAGLMAPDSGSVEVDGVDVGRHPTVAQGRIGFAPQQIGVYKSLSARENLMFFGELVGLRGGALRRRVMDVAEAFRLTGFLDRTPRELSGGETRRVHTAMAVLHRPALLLLDEVTAGVDVLTRQDVLDVVRALAGEGSAVCYSTHYLVEVEALRASVAIIDDGTIIARGGVDQLISGHGQGVVELAFAGPPPVVVSRGRIEYGEGSVRVFADDPAREAARLLTTLPDLGSLRSVEIVRPSLETVFMSLTGRRYGSAVAGGPEMIDARQS